jgi:hypothetical protein
MILYQLDVDFDQKPPPPPTCGHNLLEKGFFGSPDCSAGTVHFSCWNQGAGIAGPEPPHTSTPLVMLNCVDYADSTADSHRG